MPSSDADTLPGTEATYAPFRAALWMVGSLVSFVIIAVAGREASRELDTPQIMLLRSLMALPVVVIWALCLPGGLLRLRTRQPALQLLRNAAHFVGQYCWFLALTLIPLAQVFALEFTAPIMVALLAPLLIGERLTSVRLLAALVGFLGVMLVIRPASQEVGVGTFVMLTGALGFALSMIAVKRLITTDDPLSVLFYMSVMQAPVAFIISVWTFAWPPLTAWGWMVPITLCALSAHFCMARAFQLADAIVVAPLDFFRLPLIALVAMLIYAEPLELWVLAGGAVIVAANVINLRAEARSRRKAASQVGA